VRIIAISSMKVTSRGWRAGRRRGGVVEATGGEGRAGRLTPRAGAALRFRPEESVREALHEAGLRVSAIYGGWNREPVGMGDGELIALADRP
jgi:hypothetical protein